MRPLAHLSRLLQRHRRLVDRNLEQQTFGLGRKFRSP
jgi:hypothetical protein